MKPDAREKKAIGDLHRLLRRQISRATQEDGSFDFDTLYIDIDRVYREFDVLRLRQERAMALVAEEMSLQNMELERMHKEAEMLAREAQRANTMKSDFFANMSHEIRTPLNSIIGMLALIVRDQSLSEEHRSMLEISKQSSNHLLNIVNNILDLSKMEAGYLELESISPKS